MQNASVLADNRNIKYLYGFACSIYRLKIGFNFTAGDFLTRIVVVYQGT